MTLAMHCGNDFDAGFDPYQCSFEPIRWCHLSLGEAMQRREFIKLIGGAAAGYPLVARAQQGERMRRIGVLTNLAADDPESQSRIWISCKACRNWVGLSVATPGLITALHWAMANAPAHTPGS